MAGRGSSILCGAVALLLARPVSGGPEARVVVVPSGAAGPARGAPAAQSEATAPGQPEADLPARHRQTLAPEALPRPAQEPPEPSLAEVMATAARVAAGSAEEDDSRLSRARAAHWAPQLRAQAQRADSEALRAGVQSSAPLQWNQQGQVDTWSVAATWDLSQLVYDRDENQLALSRVHLARRRQEVAQEAAERYVERLRLLAALAAGPRDTHTALLLLRCTAALDGLTAGLYQGALARAQALVTPSRASFVGAPEPGLGAGPGPRGGSLSTSSNPELR